MGAQRRLDLAELDAVAADLDLEVEPAEELERAVGQPAGQVTGAVQAPLGIERIGHEPLRRQLGTVQVAAGDTGTTDEQLAGHADRRQLAGRCRAPGTPCWRSDGRSARAPASSDAASTAVHRRPDRGLGRAEHVPHRPATAPAGGEPARRGIASPPHSTFRPAAPVPPGVEQHRPRRRRGLHHRRARRRDQLGQAGDRRSTSSRRRHHHPRPRHQRHEQLQHRDVERQRRHRQQHVVGAQARLDRHRPQEVHDAGVRRPRHPWAHPVDPDV